MNDKIKKRNIKLIALLIAAGVLAAFLAILLVLRTNAKVAEWVAVNISRGYITFASKVTSVIPFSLYETFLYVAIISLIALLTLSIIFLCKKKTLRALSYLLIIAVICLSFGNVYTLSAGFTYFRGEIDVPYHEAEYLTDDDKQVIFAAADFMIDDFNAVARAMVRDEQGRTVSPYTHGELAEKLIEEYKRLDTDYFSSFTPRAKTITSKNIMSHMHITGVFFAPFGEANVNPLTPASDMPVTMAHELAHAKGAMRESDANLVAYWLTLTSQDKYLRYSGYKSCYSYMITLVSNFDLDKADELYTRLDECIRQEWRANSEFWSKYTILEDITEWFNNLYLKLQGQKDGTASYNEPIIPPSEIVVPDGGTGGGDQPEIITVYNLNNVQRMILKAVEDRMSNE